MDHASEARRVVALLADGDVHAVRSMFNHKMAASPQVSAEALAAVWRSVIDEAGDYASAGDPEVHTTVDLPLTFARGRRSLTVSFDGDGKVSGMFIRP